MSAEEIVKETEKDKGFYSHTGGGITVSGGEMLARAGFVAQIVKEAALKGIDVCLDTSGFGNYEELRALASQSNVTDILYDMKCIISQKHLEGTGVDNAIILENLTKLASDEAIRPKITMRMPLIKGYNDSDEVIGQTVEFYDKNNLRRVTLLPYHTLGISKSERIGEVANAFLPPSKDRVNEIRAMFEGRGIFVEVLGE